MFAYTKKSTLITGLQVAKDPHYTLGVLYGKILRALANLPENSKYRQYTEKIISERTATLKSTEDPESVEKRINCGQIEELINQAENELLLARKMLAWKPWEPLMKEPPSNQWEWPPVNQKLQCN